ncbi:MAG: toll/interleukin-1 receptor domain-containing protein, partial [Anaerolineae bacterium]|nr:toll/interleukin-1 receptor domain-containing protein [Anaerolineae bacterium]
TVTLVYAESDHKLAMRIRGDLEAESIRVQDTLTDGAVVVAVLSAQGAKAPNMVAMLNTASDKYHHILPVLAEPTKLPRVIDHLQPIDMTQANASKELVARVNFLASPQAPRPLTSLTPAKRKQNVQSSLLYGFTAFGIFLVGIIAVGVFGIQAPEDEFYTVETQVYLTQRVYIDQVLPRSTEDAVNFQATIPFIPTKARQEAIATATWIVSGQDGTFVPRSTEQAVQFESTLTHLSTHVHDRIVATVTQFALTNAVITPTPTSELTPEATP